MFNGSSYYRSFSFFLKAVLLLEATLAFWERQWMTSVITLAIIAITLTPLIMRTRLNVIIPPEFELLAIAFVFASLYLGEIHGYYTRFWWWDIALHTSSGFLLGIMGFLLVYVINESTDTQLNIPSGLVAFFAFLFAIGCGALWEIFEFTMDSVFGMEMQKPMLGDPSGLTDTMWDMVANTVGASIIAFLGYGYLKASGSESFLLRWIRSFIASNPRLFRQPVAPEQQSREERRG